MGNTHTSTTPTISIIMGAVQSSSSAHISQFSLTIVDRATESEHKLEVRPSEDIADSVCAGLGKFRVTRVSHCGADVPLPLTWGGLGGIEDDAIIYVDAVTKEQWFSSAPRREAVHVVIDDILALNDGVNTFGLPLISREKLTRGLEFEGDEIKAWNLRGLGLTKLPHRLFDLKVAGLDLQGNPIRCQHCRRMAAGLPPSFFREPVHCPRSDGDKESGFTARFFAAMTGNAQ